ncbi:intraflagellar transport protein 80 homolog [Nylanderia fulva]|uniref:intraflagellar transport protein 80 homolog n=1 Tax=Nylanderia fulva TaxID=613905 RepID=UPI0010FB40BD|nr:intraflagellar transport protein 80 homolog [Nylanderia fulva]
MQWNPRPNHISIAKKLSLDALLITTADGKYHLVNRNGRIEKSVDAHKGATTVGTWNNDGSAFLTAGEDGLIKIWSRSGMLRSTLYGESKSLPILTSSWSPDCLTILYSQGTNLILQSFNSNSKLNKWHAHDSLILITCYGNNGLILSAGEDCKYKMRFELTKLKPQLEASAKDTAETLRQIETEDASVKRATILVKKDEILQIHRPKSPSN